MSVYTVINLSYCSFAAVNDDGTKVVFGSKYPPAGGTLAPQLDVPSPKAMLTTPSVTREEVIKFWNSDSTLQDDGSHKGGRWGSNNLPTTDSTWLTDLFIGDRLVINQVADGIISSNRGKPFTEGTTVIDNTAGKAWSCNATFNGTTYGVYLTDNIMPQVAQDVLFVWTNKSGNTFIKLLTRGNDPTSVDMPGRIVPGGGEHKEPGKDINVKKGVLRTIKEELGIPKTTLTQCYLLPLGKYDEQGRDPRYHTYDGGKWGLVRKSETDAHVLYIKSDTDKEPTEINFVDTTEINKKWWTPLSSVLTDYPVDRWMIADHRKFIPDTFWVLSSFNMLSEADQKKYLLFVPDEDVTAPSVAAGGGGGASLAAGGGGASSLAAGGGGGAIDMSDDDVMPLASTLPTSTQASGLTRGASAYAPASGLTRQASVLGLTRSASCRPE